MKNFPGGKELIQKWIFISDHLCYKDNENPCSDICRPLLRGLHQCLCQGDQYLADDEATCIEGKDIIVEFLSLKK